MITVNNKQVIREIAASDFRADFRRNLLSIIAILLTTFLITTACSIGLSYWKSVTQRAVMMEGMKYDIQLPEPTAEQVAKAQKIDAIQHAGVSVKCAIGQTYQERTVHIRFYYSDSVNWEKQCIPAFEFMKGEYPSEKNQIVLSTQTLKELGITKPQLGMDIPLGYYDLAQNGQKHNEKLVLSGYYRDYSGQSKGFVSSEFYKATGAKQTDLTQGLLNITLKNSIYSKADIVELKEQLNVHGNQMIFADSDMMSTFMKFVVGLLALFFIVIFSGYLFIYNILYISVSKKVQFFGQLKTVGATTKQIRHLMRLQVIWNSIVGIPLGMLLGGTASFAVVPAILSLSNPNLSVKQTVVFHPAIFIGAAIFSFLTVLISSRKPAVMAGELSPIDAAKFVTVSEKRSRRSEGGCRSWQMALRNLFREKKQAVIVFLSLFTALVAFLTINVILEGNKAEAVLNAIYRYDIRVLNQTVLDKKPDQPIDQKHLSQLKAVSGVSSARVVTSTDIVVPYNKNALEPYFKRFYQLPIATGNYEKDMKQYQKNPDDYRFKGRLVGIDAAQYNKLGLEINKRDFLSGKTGLIAPGFNISAEEAVGKTLKFVLASGEAYEVDIVGTCPKSVNYFAGGLAPDLVVSQQFMNKIIEDPVIELVDINYKESFHRETDKEIKAIFTGNKKVAFDSKMDDYDEMQQNESRIQVFGAGLGIILALLAILNYCNMIVAGIQNRTKEFAALESIGMTSSQMTKMLVFEGLGYGVISSLVALLLGIPISYGIFQSMNRYQVDFSIPVLNNAAVFMIILLICIIVPPIAFKKTQKGSIVERLRES